MSEEERAIEKKDKFFSKQMVVPVLLFVITAIVSAKTVIDKLEVRMNSVENALVTYASSHATKSELASVEREVRNSIIRQDKEIDAVRDDVKEMNKYLRDKWDWKRYGNSK